MAYGFVNYFTSLCNPDFDNIRRFNVSIYSISVAFFETNQLTGCASSLDYYVSNETDRNRQSCTYRVVYCLLFSQLQNDMIKDLH